MNSYQLRRKTKKRKVEIMTVLANFGILGQPQLVKIYRQIAALHDRLKIIISKKLKKNIGYYHLEIFTLILENSMIPVIFYK